MNILELPIDLLIETVFVVHYFLMIFVAIYLNVKFKFKWKKTFKLVFLPPLLLGFGSFIFIVLMQFEFMSLRQFSILSGASLSVILMVVYTMFPALMLFSVSIQLVEKKFKPRAIGLFLWAALLSISIVGIHTLFMLSEISDYFIVPIISSIPIVILIGTVSVMIQYYLEKRGIKND